jgi:DNA-binding CsgD family transcriptional regulator
VLVELGSAELRLAMPETAGHLREVIDLVTDPVLITRSARLLANALTMSGDADGAVAALHSAIDVVAPADRELSLLLEAELAAHAQEASLEARAPAARRLERLGDLPGDTPGERMALASRAFERARSSESAPAAAACIERGLAGGRMLAEQENDVAGPFYLLQVSLRSTDALDLADAALEQALDQARARASIPALAFLLAHRAPLALRRGAVPQAEADARTALDLLNAHDIPLGRALALSALIEALVESGDVKAADAALHGSDFRDDIPAGLPNNALLEARAILLLAQERHREGVDDLLEFGRRDELSGGANPLASRWRARAATALATMGHDHQARQLAIEDLENARRWGAASGIGIALRAHALVVGGAAGIEGLRDAVHVLEDSVARLEHARALAELGAALRRANRRTEARAALHEAIQRARRCGANALIARARTELRAAGGRSADPAGKGVQTLTASERRVAELAAAGRSNPEIAQALFVTRKTVETHLSRIYQKLHITGRWGLPAAMAGDD